MFAAVADTLDDALRGIWLPVDVCIAPDVFEFIDERAATRFVGPVDFRNKERLTDFAEILRAADVFRVAGL